MTLPLLLSVPHAGIEVPPEARGLCALTPEEIAADGDEGAAAIYDLAPHVHRFETTSVARAIVDLNRAEDDRRKDGVVKTHTCWDVPVWKGTPAPDLVESLLSRYHRPFHERLSAPDAKILLGVDCHTMASHGPPVGPDPGVERPPVCLSDAGGTLPAAWFGRMVDCFRSVFPEGVAVNRPFLGGYIIRTHAAERPWVQIELSRAPFLSLEEKRARVLAALRSWCASPER